MTILSVETISKTYGARTLFRDVSFGLNRGERMALIGVNGCGKTSLLRILAGVEPPDTGRVAYAGGTRVIYLPQDPELPENATVIEAVFAGDSPTIRLLREYEALSIALEHSPDNAALSEQLAALMPQMDALNAWEAEAAARSIITQLGLADAMQQPVRELSGGQRKRTAMARALVDRPDLLILDEPTNHIDTDTIAWLESYLSRVNCALLLVTHDRYFLDRIVNRMVEIDRGNVYFYEGNYAAFLEQKADRETRSIAAEEARKNLLRRELAWLRRGARARTTKQKAHVERVYDLMEQRADAAQGRVEIDLAMARRLGKRVLELKKIGKSYGNRTLIDQFSIELRQDERLGIIGPNGSGKSTLLNIMANRLEPDSGERLIGETVFSACYSQESEGLDPNQRVVDYVREAAELVRGREGALVAATQMLERFLFPSETQWATIGTLSGGERRRLYLLRTLLFAPNLLFLDEPTNDLDIQTLSVLEDYLDGFAGAVVAVSHDRYFLDRVADRIIAFEGDGRIVEYPGNYSLYAEYRAQRAADAPAEKPKPKPAAVSTPIEPAKRKLTYKERRELGQLEERIGQLEQRHTKVSAELNAAGSDYQRYTALANELAEIDRDLAAAMERWAELAELAEN